MRKIFTLALALMGFVGANAATVDDIAVCKHSYVLVFDDWCGNGTAKPGKGQLFGNGYFLDVTGGSVATNKGSVNLSVVNEADENHVTQAIADKYGATYPDAHLNSWRLKNAQDVIAMKVTAGSKLIFFLHGNAKSGTSARIPKIAKDAALSEALNAAPDESFPTTDTGFRYEWTAEDDGLIYIGSYNGDTFFSYLIVEANEAEGSPSVTVGDQVYEGGLWYREVSCKPAQAYGMGTIVTYTTDGTAPTAASAVYKEPIKCYKEMTLKFQAFMDLGTGTADQSGFLEGADNEANVNFKFEAPTISAEGATVTITSPYEGAENYILVNGDNEEKANSITLEESATITAYSKIINGDYAEFTSNSSSKDVYVLNPIKEKKTIAVTTGTAVLDEEATAKSTTGEVYKVEDGAISADKMDFFVKNLEFAVVKDAQYQIDEKDIYIKMNNTNITFLVADGDSVNVKVVCSKNSCKMLENDDESKIDKKCYVNVDGKTYGHDDVTEEGGNIIEFGLIGGIHTFQKYSGTGNILISSIEITPVAGGANGITSVNAAAKANGAIFNLAGQKVAKSFKGIMIMNGKKVVK